MTNKTIYLRVNYLDFVCFKSWTCRQLVIGVLKNVVENHISQHANHRLAAHLKLIGVMRFFLLLIYRHKHFDTLNNIFTCKLFEICLFKKLDVSPIGNWRT